MFLWVIGFAASEAALPALRSANRATTIPPIVLASLERRVMIDDWHAKAKALYDQFNADFIVPTTPELELALKLLDIRPTLSMRRFLEG
jgi:hypothetical protein